MPVLYCFNGSFELILLIQESNFDVQAWITTAPDQASPHSVQPNNHSSPANTDDEETPSVAILRILLE